MRPRNSEAQMRVDRLFTYGSLQPGGPNEHLLAGLDGEWHAARVKGRLVDEGWGAGIGYPALQLDDTGDTVHGWVFTSPELSEHWTLLDDFEGHHYRRVSTDVALSDGKTVVAHVYVLR